MVEKEEKSASLRERCSAKGFECKDVKKRYGGQKGGGSEERKKKGKGRGVKEGCKEVSDESRGEGKVKA